MTSSQVKHQVTHSYSATLKSTSIIGGSQAISYVIALVKTKLVAVLLGADGLGMVHLFLSTTTLIQQITGLGIGQSGVREIAKSHGSELDEQSIGQTVCVLRRACWFTGTLGWVCMACFSLPLSRWAFGTQKYAGLIAILGVTLLLTAVSSGQRAVIQGTRRIRDFAQMGVISSLANACFAIVIYAMIGERGIVPVLIATAVINVAVSWWFARRISVAPAHGLSWVQTIWKSKQLAQLGVAFMWGGVLAALVNFGTRALITSEIGVDGNGIYQAAWGLSGMFAGFVLSAMGTDFYPRLTAISDDHPRLNATVNEQIEIGVLIALPGLLATLTCGPLLMIVFYSNQFILGAELLPWFVLGVFLRVVSWPLGFAILAKSATRWFFLTQTHFYVVQFALTWLLIRRIGLVGVAIAFFLTLIPAAVLNLAVVYRLTGFTWSIGVIKLLTASTLVVLFAFLSTMVIPVFWNALVGIGLTFGASLYCANGLAARLGRQHKLVLLMLRIPGLRFVLPGSTS